LWITGGNYFGKLKIINFTNKSGKLKKLEGEIFEEGLFGKEFNNGIDFLCKVGIGFDGFVNFFDRVQDSGVMFATEFTANFIQRRFGQLFADVHRNLSGMGNISFVAFGNKVIDFDIVFLGDKFANAFDGDGFLFERDNRF
jgi:hypothetical protein